MWRWVILVCVPLAAGAQENFVEVDAGPFQVLSSAGDRTARETLNQLEQLRYALGSVLGKPDLETTWPVRVLMGKGQAVVLPALARDTFTGALPANAAAPPEFLRKCARLLVEANCARMPGWIEQGLEQFYGTIEVSGTRLTLGQPPPAAERNLSWARIQLLQTSPEYSGKLRVLLYNVQQGAELEPSFRNAFGKPPAQLEAEAKTYLSGGKFETVLTSGKPLDARRDFTAKAVEAAAAQAALADLRYVGGGGANAYLALRNAAPAAGHEGLGLVALREKRAEEARQEFAAAVAAGSQSARAWLEAARLEPDDAKAVEGAKKAALLNPHWAEPHVVIAERDPAHRVGELERAAKLEPRNASLWRALAEANLAANKYPEAARAWAAAENASLDDAERARIRAARRAIEQQRLDYEAAERKRQEEEKQKEIRQLKDQALARVRAAEDRANQGAEAPKKDRIIVPWSGEDQAPSGKVRGRMVRVDCLKGPARLTIETAERKAVKLLMRDPRKVIVAGGGQLSLTCGVQKKPASVSIEYFPRHDAKLGTEGEVATIEFLKD